MYNCHVMPASNGVTMRRNGARFQHMTTNKVDSNCMRGLTFISSEHSVLSALKCFRNVNEHPFLPGNISAQYLENFLPEITNAR